MPKEEFEELFKGRSEGKLIQPVSVHCLGDWITSLCREDCFASCLPLTTYFPTHHFTHRNNQTPANKPTSVTTIIRFENTAAIKALFGTALKDDFEVSLWRKRSFQKAWKVRLFGRRGDVCLSEHSRPDFFFNLRTSFDCTDWHRQGGLHPPRYVVAVFKTGCLGCGSSSSQVL